MVRTAIIAACWVAATPVEACRLALVLALDVSSSVDEAEDAFQRQGLARALIADEVRAAFFATSAPVALVAYEWSGRGHQTNLMDWTLIETDADLDNAAARIAASQRSATGLPTAMGHALAYASILLDTAPACSFQTVDIAGDGVNNAGFGPANVYATFPFDGVTVNGLVIAQGSDGPVDYYRDQVIRGPLAFVEVADGFADFETAMRQKLVRELSAQIIGRRAVSKEVEQG